MSDPKAPHSKKRKMLDRFKRYPFPLSAVLIIVSYLGFMSMSLIPLSTDSFKEVSGQPAAARNLGMVATSTPDLPTDQPPSPTPTASLAPTNTPIPTRTPTQRLLPTKTATPDPNTTTTASLVSAPEGSILDWGDWSCRYCDKMPAKVRMSHYWPPLGGENCWWFYEGYCHSPMKSSVPWETLIEIAAACPTHWLGGVVEIPEIGRRFLCLDTGEKVVCEDDICVIDVLTEITYPWEGSVYDATVYYPRVWTDGSRPQATPFADEQGETSP